MPFADLGALEALAAASSVNQPTNPLTANVINGTAVNAVADTSWIAYNCELEYVQRNHIARHKPLAGAVTVRQTSFDITGDANRLRSDTRAEAPAVTSKTPDILQRVSGPTVRVILSGHAVREEFAINPPCLLSFQGIGVIEQERKVKHSTPLHIGGMPIHVCRWRIVYELTGVPAQVPLPGNAMLGIPGSAGYSTVPGLSTMGITRPAP